MSTSSHSTHSDNNEAAPSSHAFDEDTDAVFYFDLAPVDPDEYAAE